METAADKPNNRERRKEVGKVFFDLSKYLLTTVAIGSLIAKEVNALTTAVAAISSFMLMALAYYITPLDKEDTI
ncbi:MAG: hypothetical protein A2W09_02130 [Deltaproteobacteria bacterium RBG_16_50_11]|nr:MAG: hypothetical protein A2W09_02130 [Deltaproteobacteria bacterium RBG_16_50_11]